MLYNISHLSNNHFLSSRIIKSIISVMVSLSRKWPRKPQQQSAVHHLTKDRARKILEKRLMKRNAIGKIKKLWNPSQPHFSAISRKLWRMIWRELPSYSVFDLFSITSPYCSFRSSLWSVLPLKHGILSQYVFQGFNSLFVSSISLLHLDLWNQFFTVAISYLPPDGKLQIMKLETLSCGSFLDLLWLFTE